MNRQTAPVKPAILLVSDDNALLHHFGPVLQQEFVVRASNSWERALKVAAQAARPCAAVILMPATPEQRAALAAVLPDVPIEHRPKPVHLAPLLHALRKHGGLPAAAGETGLAGSLAGRRALVAEDDELLQLAITENLKAAGVGTAIATDGAQTIALAGRERFDWVLMDVNMPVMNGLEATRRLRADAVNADLCIIAVTGNDDAESRATCLAAGMSDFLTKPLTAEQIIAKLGAWHDRPHDRADGLTHSATAATRLPKQAVDLARLASLGQGKPARMRKYAAHFIDTIGTGLPALEAALASNDLNTLIEQAHRLKSSARWVGALALGEHLAELECAAKAADAATIATHLAACRHASADFLTRLHPYLDSLPEVSA